MNSVAKRLQLKAGVVHHAQSQVRPCHGEINGRRRYQNSAKCDLQKNSSDCNTPAIRHFSNSMR